ncbi:helix-turn-helix domain-containing protein [Pseudoroseicyclus tamaricis]|uniref:Helix-turn-helix transcriptional regulator n=1 Tax=Pseudoroseicyclus tamaricis TaxID=2705421 RepID=A0A6B2K1B3_9RHOB|nr:helix-turn-helix transcriptional regulator [Pseudoroseicyclus tamaricis]NDV01502.1 helix-turn-helix transcriptional regulator [Pseudoroseicyclus tamaricis]
MTPEDGWYSEDSATLGDRIAGAREAAGLAQKELAARLGVKVGTVERWEDDRAEPRANKLQMLSGMLGVSLSWMLTGVGDGPDGPGETDAQDNAAELAEIRKIRAEMTATLARLGRLEKRLRAG